MNKVNIDPMRPVYPTPVALVTSMSREGRPNIIALGEVFNISLRNPPIIGLAIRKATYSYKVIAETREFVVNFSTTAMLRQADMCGCYTGRDTDKFEKTGLTPFPADKVRPPLIEECPLNIECRLLELKLIGDHDLFLGEVVASHADASVLDADGKVDPARLDVLSFMFNYGHVGEYWSLGRKLGEVFFMRTNAHQ